MGDSAKSILNDDDITKSENGLIFNPYNSNNQEITLNEVQSILQRYGVPGKVHNLDLYKRAFVHSSYTKRPHLENTTLGITIADRPEGVMGLKTKSNERLEFLGDGVLECITKYYLYRRFPKENEGFMTEKKIAVVKNESIGRLAYDMRLNKWLILSRHAEEKKIRTNLKKLGCLFEAFIGALFLDFNKISIHDDDKWFDKVFVTGPGFQIAQIFVENIFEQHIDWTSLIKNDDNYKNILQVKIQKEFKRLRNMLNQVSRQVITWAFIYVWVRQYMNLLETALMWSDFKSFHTVQEYMQENDKVLILLGVGQHKIKKKAEQEACESALKCIN